MSRVELLASYWTISGGAEPHTDHEWSPFSLRERAEAASKAGFTGLGLWHADLVHIRERHSLPEMRGILADNGIRHLELEFLTDWFLDDGERRRASDEMRRVLLESAEALGARHVKVGDFSDSPVPMPKLIESFAELCEDAAEHGTNVAFEMMPFSVIHTLEDALTLVQGANAPNGGICIDLWHVVKLGVPYESVAAIPKRFLTSIELNDGYLEVPQGMSLHEETINHRQFCGEGQFDVRGFVERMRVAGYAAPWGIEVLNAAHRKLALPDLVGRAYRTTRAQFHE
jgi:sugar phosphate isomerase/epimerase